MLVTDFSDDALQRRIARLVGPSISPKAFNCASNSCLGTSLGAVRKENQDRALIVWADYAENHERNFTLAVLSDGMGGLMNGDEAATMTVSVFVSRVLRTPRVPTRERLRNAAQLANDAVYGRFGSRGGATLSAVFLGKTGPKVGVNVGDSRIYAVTKNRDLIQVSQDDTLAGVLGERPGSSENRNRLVQFMGMGEGIEPNILDFGMPEIESILLTSDGVHGAPIATLSQIVRRSRSDADLARKLLSLSEVLGGQDNGTVIALGNEEKRDFVGSDQGLNLTILSASERLEVWIPVLADEARTEKPRTSHSEKTEPKLVETSTAPTAKQLPLDSQTEAKKKRKSPPRVSRSNKGRTTEQQGLALGEDESGPVLDVKFPPSE